jgi:outer membrane protein assembly factor BamB
MTTLRILTLLLLTPALAPAADWPHWMGPTRDNVWPADGLLDKFPEGGPKVVWRAPVAGGYAGPAVVGGKVFCSEYRSSADLGEGNFERKAADGEETVFALDAATGKRLWEQKYPVKYTISYPAGPRCTPTVDGSTVYFLGAEGNLLACDTADGKIIWQKDLKLAYKTKSALWGYAAAPLIDGDKLITLAGGEGSHVVALNKKTGAEIWRAESSPEQGYVPPTIINAAGTRQLIVCGPKAVKGLDPATGKRLWATPYDATNGSIIMTPLVVDGYLFIGGYLNKNLLLKLTSDKPGVEVVARDVPKKFVTALNVQPYAEGSVVYGIDCDGLFYATEIPSGKRLWSSDAYLTEGKTLPCGTAFLVRNGGRVWMFNELGELVIAKVTPEGYKEIDRAKLLEPTGKAFGRQVVWSQPAFAGTRMYVRNDKELICVELAK